MKATYTVNKSSDIWIRTSPLSFFLSCIHVYSSLHCRIANQFDRLSEIRVDIEQHTVWNNQQTRGKAGLWSSDRMNWADTLSTLHVQHIYKSHCVIRKCYINTWLALRINNFVIIYSPCCSKTMTFSLLWNTEWSTFCNA